MKERKYRGKIVATQRKKGIVRAHFRKDVPSQALGKLLRSVIIFHSLKSLRRTIS